MRYALRAEMAWLLATAITISLPACAQSPAPLYAESGLPASFAGAGRGIAFFNTPNRDAVPIHKSEPTVVGKVSLDLAQPSAVLVQFTSGLAAETSEGCPCSVRLSLKVDDQPLLVIKRVNVGAPSVQGVDKYEHDRQPGDGSYVFALPKGPHDIALVVHQVGGAGEDVEAYYVNLQAIPFPN